MTTLAVDKPRRYELGNANDLPVKAATKIFEGAFVGLSGAFARPLVAGDKFLGIATSRADNTSGANGDINVHLSKRGRVVMPVAGASATSIAAIVYASDDDTLTLTSTSNTPVGSVIRFVSGTTCVVDFDVVYQSIP